ncbi:hypothetical protein KIN20_013218 [Parelaphostrongylus tenuis]|uniref:GRAM domain-containing protein n=1 Tax=Parelaphostrongylus tenuis TaxID=148309 RepID=A0AAD5MBU6_PARTN|nr:hypothetical protein KIN20_013218 [Parelaphostrongylus tenuis]
MSINTSNTPDGKGVLIFNGEMILLYTTNVKISFSNNSAEAFKGTKDGSLYLTSHRIIFMNKSKKDLLKSFSMPFQMLRNVTLEQPLITPNYLKGDVEALPDGQFEDKVEWKLVFPKGGCIEFGQSLLHCSETVSRVRAFNTLPAYTLCAPNVYYFAPPAYYMPPSGKIGGFQAPTHVFPEKPQGPGSEEDGSPKRQPNRYN